MNPHFPPSSAEEGLRLSKRVMAETGCSRTEAERLIEGGRVQVEGRVVREIPRRVQPHQQVTVDRGGPAAARGPVTLLLHKPAAVPHDHLASLLAADHQWSLDRSGQTLSPRQQAQVSNVTPLEDAASGLVVWTQAPGIVRRLVDEGSLVEHELMADVRGPVSAEQLKLLNQVRAPGAAATGLVTGPRVQASIGHQHGDTTRLRLAFKGYWPGLALEACDAAGLTLLSLKRTRIGRLSLKDLPEGQWRGLMGYERF